jgi:hypothetical protein
MKKIMMMFAILSLTACSILKKAPPPPPPPDLHTGSSK